jgi:integrase/recombinase XerD
MSDVRWESIPLVAEHSTMRSWLQIQANLQRAQNTVDAYGRALQDFLGFCRQSNIDPNSISEEHIAAFVRNLAERSPSRTGNTPQPGRHVGLSNATMQLRLTAVRLYYDYAVQKGLLARNPVGRGQYTPGAGFGGQRARGLIPQFETLPWIPDDQQWLALLQVVKTESLRNRFMFALAYDAGLRREELCHLQTDDLNPGQQLVRIRAETTKNRRARVVPYSDSTGRLYALYLTCRRALSREHGALFLSESRRNTAHPISIWTWSKVIEGIAERASIPQFTTHTLRHLCLTDLARAGWDTHEIAQFAGHRHIQTTLRYIHVSGRDLAAKLTQTMQNIHVWRANSIEKES